MKPTLFVLVVIAASAVSSVAIAWDRFPSPFEQAVEKGDLQTVKKLLPANLDKLNKSIEWRSGYYLLHTAASRGHADIVALLISKGAKVGVATRYKKTPLHLAVMNGGTTRAAKILIDKGAKLSAKDSFGQTPLFWANAASTKLLLDSGASIHATDMHQWTPLHVAAAYGWADKVSLLIARGALLNTRNTRGHEGPATTPIEGAIKAGHAKVAALLIAKGVKPKNPNKLLHFTSAKGHVDAVRLLITLGADVTSREGELAATPLHKAANAAVAELLLAHGAKVDAPDKHGNTPLHMTGFQKRAKVVQVLLKWGADVDATDGRPGRPKEGRTALHFTAAYGDVETAKVLIAHGADVNKKSSDRQKTPLHYAAIYHKKEMVVLLLDHGAKINAASEYGQTPTGLAAGYHRESPKKGYGPVIELLRSRGGKTEDELSK